ncbi:hypothetical protein CR513_14881, partial [Mucuna pruriens]
MASACSRIAQRTSISSIKSAIKSNIRASSFSKPASSSNPLRQSLLSRISAEVRCAQSLLPLHSAVAAARMTSCLSTAPCGLLTRVAQLKRPPKLVGLLKTRLLKVYSLVYQFQGDLLEERLKPCDCKLSKPTFILRPPIVIPPNSVTNQDQQKTTQQLKRPNSKSSSSSPAKPNPCNQ